VEKGDSRFYWLAAPASHLLATGIAGACLVAIRVADFIAFPRGWHNLRRAFHAAPGYSVSARTRAGPQAEGLSTGLRLSILPRQTYGSLGATERRENFHMPAIGMQTLRMLPGAAALVMALATGAAIATDNEEAAEHAPRHWAHKGPKPTPLSRSTQHELRLDGQVLRYTATVGWLILTDDKDKPIARFGYTAYTLDGTKDLARRPITFAFNGGPGSASIWLHMGVLGPRRVVVNDGGYAPPPPTQLVDNEYSVLDATDLVMIDPVGTGFSKPVGKGKGKDFWGVDQDIKSVGSFIRRYVTENGRWGSPKYVLGESYGGVRGAGLAHHLQSSLGMNLNGLILVSPYFGIVSGDDSIGIDLPHVLYLSTFAATAWYYDAVAEKPVSLDSYVAEVERFAYAEYAPALLKGYAIPVEEKKAIAEKLARYTGTTAEFWQRADLRVGHVQFLQELLRGRGLIAGRIDSRFSGPSLNPLNDVMDYDPFFPAIGPAFTAGFREYLHSELKFDEADDYVVSADLYKKWDWKHEQPGVSTEDYPQVPMTNTLPDLSMAMTMNPGLYLLVEQGLYDLATPTFALKYNLDHLRLTPEARTRIRVNYHEAGHMMYINAQSARRFRDNVAGFIRDTDRL
jgi:carboxypeptidase C (cathepsin A)